MTVIISETHCFWLIAERSCRCDTKRVAAHYCDLLSPPFLHSHAAVVRCGNCAERDGLVLQSGEEGGLVMG